MRGDVAIDHGQLRVRLVDHQGHTWPAALADAPIQWDLAQERDLHPLGQGLRATMAKNLFAFAAMRADEVTHVFDQPQVRDLQGVEHLDGAPDVGRGDVLWRRDDDGARHRNALGHGQLNVTRARRKVDDEIVQLAPVDVEQELPDGAGEHWPAPDGGLIGLDKEGDGNNLEAIALDRSDLFVFGVGLFVLGAEKNRHVGAVHIGVQHADSSPQLGQRQRDVHGAGRLADAALAGADGNNILDALDLLLLRHATGPRDLGVPFDLRFRRARQRRQGRIDVIVDLVLQGTGRRGKNHPHSDRLRTDHSHVLVLLELDHDSAKLPTLYGREHREDVGFRHFRDSHHYPVYRELRM